MNRSTNETGKWLQFWWGLTSFSDAMEENVVNQYVDEAGKISSSKEI